MDWPSVKTTIELLIAAGLGWMTKQHSGQFLMTNSRMRVLDPSLSGLVKEGSMVSVLVRNYWTKTFCILNSKFIAFFWLDEVTRSRENY